MSALNTPTRRSGGPARAGRVPRRRSARPPQARDRRAGPRKGRRTLYPYVFAAPAIVLVLVFFTVPFLANAVFAFTRWTSYNTSIAFNGLTNFRVLNNLGLLWHATRVTVVYALIGMVVQNIVSVSLAKALQDAGRAENVFRSIFFVPVLISPLAAGYIWSAVLSPQGPYNSLISLLVPGFAFNWLGHGGSALVIVAVIDAWKWSGLVTLVYIAGLNRIPRPVIEAARIDGAGSWRRFWTIEVPLLAPAFTFNVVITLVGAFSSFDVIFSTTSGGPGDYTSVLNFAIYQQYGAGYFGSSSALGLVITLLVIVTAVPLIAVLRRREVRM